MYKVSIFMLLYKLIIVWFSPFQILLRSKIWKWNILFSNIYCIWFSVRCEYEATQKSHLVRHLETHNVVKRFQCQHCDYSANTLGYIKIHYTRTHEGCTYTHNPEATNQQPVNSETKVYKCLSCDYLFGNLCDMKRHLKIRHHVQVSLSGNY